MCRIASHILAFEGDSQVGMALHSAKRSLCLPLRS